MNLFEILKSKVSSTSPGLHVPGLRAVAAHIDAANRHFTRGQSDQDETAFTDAIYRCNQAFEGSIKEAYRVLAQKDPSRETVNAIEEYLSKNDVLRPRILVQLKNYRQEWRNPSTHDYKLDFDEDEALLAIASVTAFSCVLCDQIIERLTFIAARTKKSEDQGVSIASRVMSFNDFFSELVQAVAAFGEANGREEREKSSESEPDGYAALAGPMSESRLLGALGGYLAATFPNAVVIPETAIKASAKAGEPSTIRPDMAIKYNDELVIVEIKAAIPRNINTAERNGVLQLGNYMERINHARGILFIMDSRSEGYQIRSVSTFDKNRTITVITPNASKESNSQT